MEKPIYTREVKFPFLSLHASRSCSNEKERYSPPKAERIIMMPDPPDPTAEVCIDENVLFCDNPPLDEVEKRYAQQVLDSTHGDLSQAAKILGIDRRTLQHLLLRERCATLDESIRKKKTISRR
jgi:DNA-binding NtrC family response regulator